MNDAQKIRAEIFDKTVEGIRAHKANAVPSMEQYRSAFIQHGRSNLPKEIELGGGCGFSFEDWVICGDGCTGLAMHAVRSSAFAVQKQQLLDLEAQEAKEAGKKSVKEKKEDKVMSKQGLWEVVKSETADAAIAAATKTAVKSVRNTAVAALESRADSQLAQEIAGLLKTEIGVAALSLAMGLLMHAAPERFSSNPQLMLLAKNFRTDGLRYITGEALTAIAEPLLAAMSGPLALAATEISKLEGGVAGALPEA